MHTSSINNVVGFEGKTYNLALGYDTSVYYLLTEGSEEIIIRPTYNGISLTREGETIAYPYNDYSRLIGDFENENISYSFDGTSLKINGQELYYASEKLRDDDDVVMAAVTNKGLILKYASKRLRADKKIALAAVKSDKRALDYISDEDYQIGVVEMQFHLSFFNLSYIH